MKIQSFISFLFLAIGFQACGQAIVQVDTPALLETLKPTNDSLRIINFWATWCKPCVAEMPHLKAWKQNHPETGFVFVSLDFQDDVAKVEQFAKVKDLPGTQLLMTNTDYNSWLSQVHPDWDGSIPFTLVQYKGRTRIHKGSFSNLEDIEKLINSIKNDEK